MLTWTDTYQKFQRWTKSNNADDLTQAKQDINTGYHMFNAKLARYYSRVQLFTNLISNQSIYQMPISAVRIIGLTVQVTSTYTVPMREVRDEYEWRLIKSYPQSSNWPTHYFIIGNDEVELWPTPTGTIVNGIRMYFQPQDHDLSVDDVSSTSTGATVTVVNGSPTVTATASIFSASQIGLSFQLTNVTDLSWYEIVAASGTTLTLKSAFVAPSQSGASWRIGQTMIIPQEYQDAPIHYATGLFWSANGNEARAQYHLGTKDKPGMFYDMMQDCKEEYSSAEQSLVITDDDLYINPWNVTPIPHTGP